MHTLAAKCHVFRIVWLFVFVTVAAWPQGALLSSVGGKEVLIHRDQWGVPHVYGKSAPAVAFGGGYAQAEDHLEMMLRLFLKARGEWSRVEGESVLEQDLTQRALLISETVDSTWNQVPQSSKDYYQAFAAGINRYIDTHPRKKQPWYWKVTAKDIAVYVRYTFLRNELWVATDKMRAPVDDNVKNGGGSNAWAIAGSRSASGFAMLHADPHLPWTGDLRFGYETHLKCPEFDVAGAGFFGMPLPIIGHNGDVAWAVTDNSADSADVYVEKTDPQDPDRYLDSDGQWKRMDRRTFQIDVHEADGRLRTVSRTVRYTRRGPYLEGRKGQYFSVAIPRWRDFPDPLTGFIRRAEAHDLNAFRAALVEYPIDKWNLVYADRQGNIYTVSNGVFPRRGLSYDRKQTLRGWEPDAQWKGIVPFNELPQFSNPPGGLIVQCNNSVYSSAQPPVLDPAKFLPYLSKTTMGNPPYSRDGRAFEILGTSPKTSWEDNRRAALDVRAVQAGPTLKLLLSALEGQTEPDMLEFRTILKDWDSMATLENRAVPILCHWLRIARERKLNLDAPDRQQALSVLKSAAAEMRRLYNSVSVPMREVQFLKRGKEYPVPGVGGVGSMANPFMSLFQASTTVYQNGKWYMTQGSSWLMLIEFSSPLKVVSVAPLGESEDPSSPHYADMTKLFVNRELKPFVFSDEDVTAHSERNYRLTF